MHERIDAWISAREARGALSGALGAEAERWRDVCGHYFEDAPPAMGCLLALVRLAWGQDGATTYKRDDGWRVYLAAGTYQAAAHPSEIAALVAALECAP